MIRRFSIVLLLLAVVGLTLLASSEASASGCRVFVQRKAVVVNKAVVVEPVVAAVVAPVVVAQFAPVAVPIYSAVYTGGVGVAGAAPGYGTQPPVAASQAPNEVLDLLKRMDARLSALERGPVGHSTPPAQAPQTIPPPMGKADSPPAVPPAQTQSPPRASGALGAFFGKSCVACHEAKVASRDGGGFVLVRDGVPVALTPAQKLEIIRQVRTGTMPKATAKAGGAKPTDEEFDAALEELLK